MRSRIASLALLYIKSTFSIALSTRKELKKPKTLLKTIGIGIGILFLVADFSVIFVMMNLSMYEGLKPAGLQGLDASQRRHHGLRHGFRPRFHDGPFHVLDVGHRIGLSGPPLYGEGAPGREDGSRLCLGGHGRHFPPGDSDDNLRNKGIAALSSSISTERRPP